MISNKQFGFRNKRSTIDGIVETLEFFIESKITDNLAHCVLLDLSIAFDTDDHKTVIHKCHLYVLRGVPRFLLKSHLSTRNQYVFHSNNCSITEKLYCGLPQGSVLGPLLLLLIPMIFPAYHSTVNVFFMRMTLIRLEHSTKLKNFKQI